MFMKGAASPKKKSAPRMGRKKYGQRLEWPNLKLDGIADHLREIAASPNQIFWVMDVVHEKLVYISPAFERIWGIPIPQIMKDSTLWLKAVHEEDVKIVTHAFKIQRDKGRSEEEYRIIGPDGAVRWVHNRAFAVRNTGGQIVWLAGINEDITEHKNAQTALEESRAFLALAQAIGKVGTFDIDLATGFKKWSPEMYRIWGRDPAMGPIMDNASLAKQLHADDLEKFINARKMTMEQGDSITEHFRIVLPDGSLKHLLARSKMIHDSVSRPQRIIGITQDVTEHEQSRAALMESEARLAQAELIAKIGSFEIDLITGVRSWTQGMFRIWRRDPSLGRMTREEMMLMVHPDERDRVKLVMNLLLERGIPMDHQFRIVFLDGEMRHFHTRGEVTEFTATGQPAKVVVTTQDITEQMNAQAALEESEAFLALAQTVGKVGTFEIDLVTGARKWSAELYRIWERDPVLGPVADDAGLTKFIHPEDIERLIKSRKMAIALGTNVMMQFRIVLSDGRTKHLQIRSQLIRDSAGRPQRIIGTTQDVTDQEQSRAALMESEASLAQAQSVAKIGSYEFNLVTGTRHCSAEMYRIWERDPALGPISTNEILLIVHVEDRHRMSSMLAGAIQKGIPFDEQIRIKPKGAKIKQVHFRSVVVSDALGHPIKIIGTAQDITEEKLSQERLEESERKLATIYQSVTDCIYLIEVGATGVLRISSVNDAYFRLTGYKHEQIVGRPMKEWYPQSAYAAALAKYRKAITTQLPVEWRERVRYPTGLRVTHVKLVPVMDSSGKCRQIIGTVSDITDRHSLEEAMLRSAETEQQRIGRDLHDGLGQEMAAISLLNNLLHENLRRKNLTDTKISARLAELINSAVLEIRRVSRGLQPVTPDPGGLMRSLQQLAATATVTNGPKCIFKCPEPVMVRDTVTANHLYRIAQESVQNSLRHGRPNRIVIFLTRKPDRIVLNIVDNGRGFLKRKSKVEGIGLSSMTFRAEAMNGTLEITFPRKGGVLVHCSIPVPTPSPSSANTKKSARNKS